MDAGADEGANEGEDEGANLLASDGNDVGLSKALNPANLVELHVVDEFLQWHGVAELTSANSAGAPRTGKATGPTLPAWDQFGVGREYEGGVVDLLELKERDVLVDIVGHPFHRHVAGEVLAKAVRAEITRQHDRAANGRRSTHSRST